MFEKLKYLYIGLIALAICLGSIACGDEPSELDQWSYTYVYLETGRNDNTFSHTRYYNINDGDIANSEPIVHKYKVKVSALQSNDLIVNISSNAEEILGEHAANFTFPKQVVIKANTYETQLEISLALDFLSANTDAQTFDLTLELAGVSMATARVSPKRYKAALTLDKKLTLGANIEVGQPLGTQLVRDGWKVTYSDGWRGNMNVPLGDFAAGDLAIDSGNGWLCWDMGESQIISGIAGTTWANNGIYAPNIVKFSTSNDGINFIGMDDALVPDSGSPAYSFINPVTCRYLKFSVVNEGRDKTISFLTLDVYSPAKIAE